jgi:hypothetical protein
MAVDDRLMLEVFLIRICGLISSENRGFNSPGKTDLSAVLEYRLGVGDFNICLYRADMGST